MSSSFIALLFGQLHNYYSPAFFPFFLFFLPFFFGLLSALYLGQLQRHDPLLPLPLAVRTQMEAQPCLLVAVVDDEIKARFRLDGGVFQHDRAAACVAHFLFGAGLFGGFDGILITQINNLIVFQYVSVSVTLVACLTFVEQKRKKRIEKREETVSAEVCVCVSLCMCVCFAWK